MGRQVITCFILIAFTGAGIGIPLPTSSFLLRKADEPFPCRYHDCGCLDAETCRTHCCCWKPAVPACCAAKHPPVASNDSRSADHDERHGGAILRALDCKGVTIWGIAVSQSPAPLSVYPLTAAGSWTFISPVCSEPVPQSRSLDVASPPPEVPYHA